MRLDIISDKVGERGLVSILLLFQYQILFLVKRDASKESACETQAEFKWHIHPAVHAGFGRLTPRQIMDRVFGIEDRFFKILRRVSPKSLRSVAIPDFSPNRIRQGRIA